MARMVQCVVLKAGGGGPQFPAVSRRARQAHLGQCLKGSVGAVGRPPDHAHQRKSLDPDRAQGPRLPGQGDGEVLLWRGLGEAQGIRAEIVNTIKSIRRVVSAPAAAATALVCMGAGEVRPDASWITRSSGG